MTHHKDLTMDINQPKYIVILILIGQIPMAFLSFNSIGKSLGYDYLGMTVFIYFAKLALVLITSFIACWVVSKKLKNNVVIYLMVGALFTPLLFLNSKIESYKFILLPFSIYNPFFDSNRNNRYLMNTHPEIKRLLETFYGPSHPENITLTLNT